MNRIYTYQTRHKGRPNWLRWKSAKGRVALAPEGGLFVRRLNAPKFENTLGWSLEDALRWLAR